MIDQVALRALRSSDAPAVLSAFESDPQMQRQGTVHNLAEAQAYTDRLVGPDSTAHAIAIVDAQDVVIGLIGINVDEKNLNGWFWYWIHAAYRGRGLTSRAATAVANWALSDGRLQRLELGHRVNNPASARVAFTAGFIHEGTERAKFLIDGRRVDVLTYGRLATDPWPDTSDLMIAGVPKTGVHIDDDDQRAIEETTHLTAIPGMTASIQDARKKGLKAGSQTLEW